MRSRVGFASCLGPTFFANGAEGGEARERALGSPTHPLAHRSAWRHRAGRGGSAPPLGPRAAARRLAWISARLALLMSRLIQ
jgi:hypothetical protein